jgi:hypothetical protein
MEDLTEKTDILLSIRRTLVPLAVGWVIAQGARAGFDIPAEELAGVFESLVTGGYYIVVRLIERYVPAAGMLLGAARQPLYL